MKNLDPKDIIWEDYNEVEAEKYILYYEQDTMLIRWGAYTPHYFVRKDAVGTKEKMQNDLEKHYIETKKRFQALLINDSLSTEQTRQEIEKFFILRQKYSQIFHPELDEILVSLTLLRERINNERGNNLSNNPKPS